MSRTIRNVKRKNHGTQFEDKYVDYGFDQRIRTPEQMKALKKEQHKHNRRVGKREADEWSYHGT